MATDVLQSCTTPEKAIATRAEGEQTKEKSGHVHNPYLAARKEWDERYGDLISRAKNWRAAAFLFGTIALAAVAGMVVIAKQAKVVPYVVAVDNLGRVASVGMAEKASLADDRMKRAAISSGTSRARPSNSSTVLLQSRRRFAARGIGGQPPTCPPHDTFADRI